MALEAMKRVKEAEAKALLHEETVKQELRDYEELLGKKLTALEEKSRQTISGRQQHAKEQAQQTIAENHLTLQAEEQAQIAEFEEKYERNKDAILSYLVERVTSAYGSQ